MAKEVTVEALIPQTVVKQLHDHAHLSLLSIANRCQLQPERVRDLYAGRVEHVPVSVADRLYALQADVELANPKLARRWSL